MSRIDSLAELYEKHIQLPWQKTLSGSQRILIVIYDKELERAFRVRVREFERITQRHHHGWAEVDLTRMFAEWLGSDEYREAYFEFPPDLDIKVATEFRFLVIGSVRQALETADAQSVVALTGLASLYGFLRVSDLVRELEPHVKGRLVLFFPGSKEDNNYRLLDARDGWNYLSYSIALNQSGGAL